MKRAGCFVYALCVALLLSVLTPHVFAGLSSGTATHESGSWTFADGSTYTNKYTITIDWDLNGEVSSGLSHIDVGLADTLLCPDSVFYTSDPSAENYGEATGNLRFEDLATYIVDTITYNYNTGIDGTSNNEESDPLTVNDETVIWGGYIDADLSNPLNSNIVRYQQPLEYIDGQPDAPSYPDPGAVGTGEFWFYSIYGPVEGAADLTLKFGQNEVTFTDAITGELPYCVPEPATMCLLGLGGLLLRKRK